MLQRKMQLSRIVAVIVWALIVYIIGTESQVCNTVCTSEYNPRCGTLRLTNGTILQCTFTNPCVERLYICQTGQRKLQLICKKTIIYYLKLFIEWISRPGVCGRNAPECRPIRRWK